jgi:peroxiredoxin
MKKSTIAIILLIAILMISAGMIALDFIGIDSMARTRSGREKIDRLMADIGVVEHHLATDPLAVELLNTAGRPVRLGDYRGKILFLNFWTTWCPACIIEMPSMEKLHRKLTGKNFAMVTVNIKEPALQVKKFFKKHQLTFTTLLDTTGKVSVAFGIGAIPTTFVLDKSGRIIGRIDGPRQWDSRESVALFEQLADS